MCNECGQIKCLGRCPNNTEEEKIHCIQCDSILEEGDEIYTNNNDEIICIKCFEQMTNEEIAIFFELQNGVI